MGGCGAFFKEARHQAGHFRAPISVAGKPQPKRFLDRVAFSTIPLNNGYTLADGRVQSCGVV